MDLSKVQEIIGIENAPMQQQKPATGHSVKAEEDAGAKADRQLLTLLILPCDLKKLNVSVGGGDKLSL